MPTIVEALTACAAAMNDAVAQVLALRDDALTRVNNLITAFTNRPIYQLIWCDPINGNDANDGLASSRPKKSLDAIFASMTGPYAVQVMLMNNATLQSRSYVNGSLTIYGVQASNGAAGYTYVRRTISVLGLAVNSPILDASGNLSTGAGIFMGGPNFHTAFIDFALQEQPAGTNIPEFLVMSSGTAIFENATITVTSANTGVLIGATTGRLTVVASFTLGSGAAGHLFRYIAAGANPNGSFAYSTNITSA